jgi:allophanate hydrolase subunit 2
LGFGGFEGRILKKGDILRIGEPRIPLNSFASKELKTSMIPIYGNTWQVRVVLGPFEHLLTDNGLETFLSYPWKVSYRAGRTGYWYDGPALQFKEKRDQQMKSAGAHPSNTISDGVPVGGIQAPFGVPVILCVDQFTIGGHAKIATVISPDMDKVGQSKPGDQTFFRQVTANEAQEILRDTEELLKEESILV